MKSLGFILTAVSIIVALIGWLLEKSDDKFKTRVRGLIFGIAVLGALLALGILIVSYVDSAQGARLQEAREHTIQDIGRLVQESVDRLGKQSQVLQVIVDNVKVPVATVGTDVGTVVEASRKGDRKDWVAYAANQPIATAGYLELRAGTEYSAAMLLAYLWTNSQTKADIGRLLEGNEFRLNDFIPTHGVPLPALNYVVLADANGTPVGFWHADAFAYELLGMELGHRRSFITLGSAGDANKIHGFHASVSAATSAADLSLKMIEQHLNETLVKVDGKVRYVELASILKHVG